MDKKTIYIILAGLAIIGIWYYMTKKGDIETGSNNGGNGNNGNTGNSGNSGNGNNGGNGNSDNGGNSNNGGNTGGNFEIKVVDTYITDPTKGSSNGEVVQQKLRRDKSADDKGKMYLRDGKGRMVEVDENKNILNSNGKKTSWKYYKTKKGVYWVYNSATVALSTLLSWLPTSTGGAVPLGIVKLDKWDSSKVVKFNGKKRYFSPYHQMFYVAKI